MTDVKIPEEVRRLIFERKSAREAFDWERADALREQIAALGWEVQDSAGRSTARPAIAVADTVPPPSLDDPAKVVLSLQVVAEDHPEDFARLVASLAAHAPTVAWELIVVANAPSFDLDQLLSNASPTVEPTVLRSPQRLGWADARTLGMQRSRGEITVLLDTSLEPIGDFSTLLLAAFEDPAVGIAGGWGVTSGDGREFVDAPPGEVDAIEGYCLAIRRDALQAVRGFDHRFRFYRNADLDFSFAVRAAGWRAICTEPLTFERHEHRGYTSLPEAERDRLSKRNFYRFLKHWGDRRDLLLHPQDP